MKGTLSGPRPRLSHLTETLGLYLATPVTVEPNASCSCVSVPWPAQEASHWDVVYAAPYIQHLCGALKQQCHKHTNINSIYLCT